VTVDSAKNQTGVVLSRKGRELTVQMNPSGDKVTVDQREVHL
jgi:hypothetical protein